MRDTSYQRQIEVLERSIRKFGDYDRSKERKIMRIRKVMDGPSGTNQASMQKTGVAK